jgi:hypothetical protein
LQAGTNSRYSTREKFAHKSWALPHLETTCTWFIINKEENMLFSGTREKSAVADSAEPKQ